MENKKKEKMRRVRFFLLQEKNQEKKTTRARKKKIMLPAFFFSLRCVPVTRFQLFLIVLPLLVCPFLLFLPPNSMNVKAHLPFSFSKWQNDKQRSKSRSAKNALCEALFLAPCCDPSWPRVTPVLKKDCRTLLPLPPTTAGERQTPPSHRETKKGERKEPK